MQNKKQMHRRIIKTQGRRFRGKDQFWCRVFQQLKH